MKMKTLSASVALALGVSIGGAAVASPTFFGVTKFEDDLLRFYKDGTNPGNVAGVIDVGDRIIDIWEITQTTPVLIPGAPAPIAPPEFTGISDVIVTGKVAAGTKTFIDATTGVPFVVPVFDFTFGANPGGFLAGLPAGVPGTATAGLPVLPPGMAVTARFWDGPAANLSLAGIPNCTSLNDCLSKASDGTLYWNAGLGLSPVESITVNGAPDIPSSLLVVSPASIVGTGSFLVSQLPGGVGPDIELQCLAFIPGCLPLIDVIGSGTILGGGSIAAAGGTLIADGAFSGGDYDFQVTVPEPGGLALLGLGLAGLGMTTARRKKFLA